MADRDAASAQGRGKGCPDAQGAAQRQRVAAEAHSATAKADRSGCRNRAQNKADPNNKARFIGLANVASLLSAIEGAAQDQEKRPARRNEPPVLKGRTSFPAARMPRTQTGKEKRKHAVRGGENRGVRSRAVAGVVHAAADGSLQLLASKANGPLNGNRIPPGTVWGIVGLVMMMANVRIEAACPLCGNLPCMRRQNNCQALCNDPQAPIYHLRVFHPALISRAARVMQARAQRTANVLNNHPASNQTAATSLSMPNNFPSQICN